MPDTVDLRNAPAGSPEWWLARLLVRLEARRWDLETFEARGTASEVSEAVTSLAATPPPA